MSPVVPIGNILSAMTSTDESSSIDEAEKGDTPKPVEVEDLLVSGDPGPSEKQGLGFIDPESLGSQEPDLLDEEGSGAEFEEKARRPPSPCE